MTNSACIIGAGIAGLATAVALERRGVEVRVFEEAPDLRTFGGALMLWTNAVRVLRELGLEEPTLTAGCALEQMQFRSWGGRLLWTMPVAETSARYGAPSLVIPRSAVVALLAHALSTPITFGKRYASYIEDAEKVRVSFDDGTSVDAKLLVGADGARSRIRACVSPGNSSFPTGQIVWVGRSTLRHEALVPGTPIGTVGRGLRFWAAPIRDEEVWWYAIVREKHHAATLEDVATLFSTCHEPVRSLIATADSHSVCSAEILDQAPAYPWSSSRVTLVGDAAHCSRPDVGQGACQALESALSLSEEVTRDGALGACLRVYERRRFSRTTSVGALARATSFQGVVENPVLSALRDVAVSTTFPLVALPALEFLLGGGPFSSAGTKPCRAE